MLPWNMQIAVLFLLTAVVSFGFVLTNSFLAVGDFRICVFEKELCAISRIGLKETRQISVTYACC